jgi:competence protein ComFC
MRRTMIELVQGFVDFFFPPLCAACGERLNRDEEVVCNSCRKSFTEVPKPWCLRCGAGAVKAKQTNCKYCPEKPVFFDLARAVVLYRGAVPELIHTLKFKTRPEVAPILGRLMFLYLKRELHSERFDLIIPVPLHSARERERGFNQAELIAEEIAGLADIALTTDILVRIKSTKQQTGLPAALRRQNVAGAFSLRAPEPILDKSILLIDDVYTTGNTVNEASRVLKERGASRVCVLTFARA